VPLAASILEGVGTAIGYDGLPVAVLPGNLIPPGTILYGGPFIVQLQGNKTFQPFTPMPRVVPPSPSFYDRYLQILSPFALMYAIVTGILNRSWGRAFYSLLLVNPRTAMIGQESADLGASARLIRAGVTVVGTRPERVVRIPDLLLLDNGRILSDELEISSIVPLAEQYTEQDILSYATSIATVAGSPWGRVFRSMSNIVAIHGSFDGTVAVADIEGIRYNLGPASADHRSTIIEQSERRGHFVLLLKREDKEQPMGMLALRPKLAAGIETVLQLCQQYGIELACISHGSQSTEQALTSRAHIMLLEQTDVIEIIREHQQRGLYVAYISDNASTAEAFETCDLAIGFTNGQSQFPVRADLLASDFAAIGAILDTGARRGATVRDAMGLSMVANLLGIFSGWRGGTGLQNAGRNVALTALGALIDGWLRMRGGERHGLVATHLIDPHPERWGQRSIEQVLHLLKASETGLTSREAKTRMQPATAQRTRQKLLGDLYEQINSPLMSLYAAGAGLSLFFGAPGDAIIIAVTLITNIVVGIWQERKASRVAEELERMGTSTANVLRDGRAQMVPATEVVPGDLLLLAAGDRVAADARILSSNGLEVDEAALTGESLPVAKTPANGDEASRILLEGSSITTGSGSAIVVAVGRQTRMGAITIALSTDKMEQTPLSSRLSRMLNIILPLSIASGGVVLAAGLLQQQPLLVYATVAITTTLAVLPEGLPLLASVSEAAVARRLADKNALVRRPAAVDALGRVDIACVDKTGTLTSGSLALSLVADNDQERTVPGELPVELRQVLLTAALASPHPDASDLGAHPTDLAIVRGAQECGLDHHLRTEHEADLAFDPLLSFYATVAQGRLCLKGAPEILINRCEWIIQQGEKRPITEESKREMIEHANRLAERGLRMLMVAEGSPDEPIGNPTGLTALGFVGISDPLRATVRATIQRCHEAGVRVIMITGDHPSTARTIAQEAGINGEGKVLMGPEIVDLPDSELDEYMKDVTVIARATPLDKVRIIESLKRLGHTIAMTGDGVNDAPALRLADVGVAMGEGGTEVARQVADVIITDDNFSTMVEAFVEGRSFWRNIRRSLGLLLGGNLGELGLLVGASLLGLPFPMTARQILAVNIITDFFPALAVALQQPEHRRLAGLNREGTAALSIPLRNDIIRRAIASAAPAFASFFITLRYGQRSAAQTVAFSTIVSTQLAQTLDAGRAEGRLTRVVLGAVAGSGALLVAALIVPSLRNLLNLVVSPPMGWLLIGASSLVSVLLNHIFSSSHIAFLEQPLATA
jgi:calcium-translocating P-type ATPase